MADSSTSYFTFISYVIFLTLDLPKKMVWHSTSYFIHHEFDQYKPRGFQVPTNLAVIALYGDGASVWVLQAFHVDGLSSCADHLPSPGK